MATKNLIKYFNAAPTDGTKMDVTQVVMEGAKRGYLIHPDACTQDTMSFLKDQTFNPNSTFYKLWSDVTNKTRFELFIDQICHYATTYGTDYQGEVYCPNGEPIEIPYNQYVVIKAVTPREMFDMCIGVLESGIALAKDTLNDIVEYIVESVKKYQFPVDLDKIQNRDALCILADKLGLMPTTGNALVRYFFYKVFGNPMPIQGRHELNVLFGWRGQDKRYAHTMPIDLDISGLTDEQIVALSEVFFRYKKFLLGLKKNRKNAPVINKIRRLADKNHKPMKIGFWEGFTTFDENYVMEHLEEEVNKLDNCFKITRLMQMITLRRIHNQEKLPRSFHIRNGKLWVDQDSTVSYAGWYDDVFNRLGQRLAEILAAKRKTINANGQVYVKYPTDLELTCPVSEKKFFGNLPFGSHYVLKDSNNYFGVYWRNEWGTRDFDISFMDDNNHKIGWNSDYYNRYESVVFSGDMTNADPEATEMFYISGHHAVPNGNLLLNRYNGEENSKYRLFFGQDKIAGFHKNYMVDPNTIKIAEMGESISRCQMVGRIQDGKVYFVISDLNNERVSRSQKDINDTYKAQCFSYLPLKMVLDAAGFIQYTDQHAFEGIVPDIDLTDLKKDTLIDLFS